jgi:hypothetical protein
MPGIVLKLDRKHDAYAIFSTVVDGFTTYRMTREQMFEYLCQHSPGSAQELIEARLVRADLCGSSMRDGDLGWDTGPVLILNGGACQKTIPREELYDWVKQEEARDGR